MLWRGDLCLQDSQLGKWLINISYLINMIHLQASRVVTPAELPGRLLKNVTAQISLLEERLQRSWNWCKAVLQFQTNQRYKNGSFRYPKELQ